MLCAIFVYLIFETQQWKRVAQETVFPGSEAEKKLLVFTPQFEYQIHATIYLTTNSRQLKVDKKINAFFNNLPFKSILK